MTKYRSIRPDELGQALPLTALFMAVLLLFAALAIDVSSVLSAERFYTTTSDAAALAGAQDLQTGRSREVTLDDRTRARTHAMHVLVGELGASAVPACDPGSDIVDCALPNTPYLVSIATPAPVCERCDPNRAIKVTVRHPAYPLTFANLAGQVDWNVESSAVAGLVFPGKYALIALKPVDSNYYTGVEANGGTVLKIVDGDIGSNTNADLDGSGSAFVLSDGYHIHYLDDSVGTPWGSTPPGIHNTSEIPDPQPPEPSFAGADVFPEQSDGETTCPSEVIALATVPDDVVCYAPGVYEAKKNNDQFLVNDNKPPQKVYLTSGVYKFEGGIDIGGELYGGLLPNQPGVTLYVPDDEDFDGENAEVIRLNTDADPAIDWAGTPMVNDDDLLVTIYVPRIESCFNGAIPIECASEPKSEPDVKLAGNAAMYIKGVIYAPTEKVGISGNSDTNAIDGQIVGWTLSWGGGSTLNLNYPDFEQLGVLRLDGACTGSLTGPGEC